MYYLPPCPTSPHAGEHTWAICCHVDLAARAGHDHNDDHAACVHCHTTLHLPTAEVVTVIFDDDSPLTQPESLHMTIADAMANLRSMRGITRMFELETFSHFVLEVEYASILVGSRLTFIYPR